jgi:hypothetical protein
LFKQEEGLEVVTMGEADLDLLFLLIYSSTFEAKCFLLRVFNGKKRSYDIMKRNLITIIGLAMVLTLALAIGHSVQAQSICTEPFTAGPVNPKNGFPLWVQDSNGVTLEIDTAGGDPVDNDSPFSVQIGFGAEAFWWSAEAHIETEDENGNDFSALIVMAVEAAFNPEVIADGNQFPFTRLRFRILSDAEGDDCNAMEGTYTVIHPYGEDKFEMTIDKGEDGDDWQMERIFESNDIEFTAAAQNEGRIGPFLVSDNAVPGSVGGVGTVTGSPCNQNIFRVIGPDDSGIDFGFGDIVETDQFTVTGNFATRAGVNVTRSSYAMGGWDPGVEVFATTMYSEPPQKIEVTSALTNTPVKMVPGGADPTGVWRSYYAFIEGEEGNVFDPSVPIEVTNKSDGPETTTGSIKESSVIRSLDDIVIIAEAYYNRSTYELEIVANTSDEYSVCGDPSHLKLAAYGDEGTLLGELTKDIVDPDYPGYYVLKIIPGLISGYIVPPSTVTVKSCFGGSATQALDIGKCEQDIDGNCVGGTPKPPKPPHPNK